MGKELIGILGAGESGVGAALLAKDKGFDVWLSDKGKINDKFRKELIENNIPFEEMGHDLEKLKSAKWVVKSPGIPDKVQLIQELKNAGIPIFSEIEFASRFTNARIVAVTGSNGKTTVSSLIYHLLKAYEGNIALAGNIGVGFSRAIINNENVDVWVLELSSFQLDNIVEFRPNVAVLLNITADHLDRYEYKMENYARAKWNITRNQTVKDVLILNEDDAWIQNLKIRVGSISKMVWLSANHPTKSLTPTGVKHNLKGRHNEFNVAVAVTVAKELGLEDDKIKSQLSSFNAIPHRLESVMIKNGVEYINDSKATNVDAVYYALEAMSQNVIWIAGGVDKGNDYSVLDSLARNKVKALIALGVDNTKLIKAFKDKIGICYSTKNIEEAVEQACKIAEDGDTVLLSPACASFDLFANYEQRGELFKTTVKKILN